MSDQLISNDRCLKTLEYNQIISRWAEYADTRMGKEIILTRIPFSNRELIEQELDQTEEALKVLTFFPNYQFGGIYSLKELLKKAQIGSILSGEELIQVLSTIEAVHRHKKNLLGLEFPVPIIQDLVGQLEFLPKLEADFKKILSDSGEILDTASAELARIRREVRSLQGSIRTKLDQVLKSSDYQKFFQESLYSVRGGRYVIPIKQEYRHRFPGIVHDQSASGSTVFIEPMALVEINNDLAQLKSAEKNEIERLLLLLSQLIAGNRVGIFNNEETITKLDFIFSKAKFSRSLKGSRPQIVSNMEIKLLEARHPLIAPNLVVPITIEISDHCRALVITGPNTGGKTVALKTTGLLVAMHQSGLFPPVNPMSKLPVFTGLFSDIGDEQSLEQSLSTFSGHITQIIEIFNRLTKKQDLILLDELGAGTDPEEGTALAIALLDKLIHENGKVLLTSHYGELKAYAFTNPAMENASMEFDLQSLRPTYRLILGIPGESNALSISKKLGLPDDVIESAGKKVRNETRELNDLLSSLRVQRDELAEQLKEIQKEKNQLKINESNLNESKKKWQIQQEKKLDELKEQNQHFLATSRQEVQTILESLKSYRQGHLVGSDLERKIQNEREKLTLLEKNMPNFKMTNSDGHPFELNTNQEINIGDGVYIDTLKNSGIVISIEGNYLWAEVGSLKLKVSRNDCKKTAEPPKLADKKSNPGRRRITRINKETERTFKAKSLGMELDVRGEYSEDALLKVEKFMDEAILLGMPFVRIIHGKGTGVLRKEIHIYLKGHLAVQKFELAPLNQGGDGATEVHFK